MVAKTKPCTLGPKHSWAWKRNVTLKTVSITPHGSTAKLSWRGDYRCACGAQKYGQSKDQTAADLAA
jgi:hypothetical protein